MAEFRSRLRRFGRAVEMVVVRQACAEKPMLPAQNLQRIAGIQADVPVSGGCIPPFETIRCQVFAIRHTGGKEYDPVGGKQ